MRTVSFYMMDGAAAVAEGMREGARELEAWGVIPFRWEPPDRDVDPVEGVVVAWEVVGEDARLTVLMSDDHAARWAVQVHADADWR